MSNLQAKIIFSGVDKTTKPLKNIMGGAKTLAQQVSTTRDKLKSLQQTVNKIDGFVKLKNQTQAVSKQFNDAKNNVQKLAIQLNQTTNPTKKLQNEFKKAQENTKRLKEQFNNLISVQQRQRAALQQAGVSTKNLAQHQVTLRNQINQTSQSLNKQAAQLDKFNAKLKRSNQIRANYDNNMQRLAVMGGVGYGAFSTGRTVARGMKNLLHVGYEFDASMSATQAVTRVEDKNDPRMLALRDQARTLPLYSKFTDGEVASGQYFLGRTGYNPDQILKAMPGMLSLAASGNMDLATTADIASNIQMAMGLPAERMDHVADVLTAMFTRNNVDIPMLGESLKYSAGIGREYGQSLETVASATALLGNVGVQGSQAGTTMRSILSRIGQSPVMKKLGVSVSDQNGNMRDLVDIMQDLHNATKNMGNVDRGDIYTKIAGRYAVTGFGALMRAVESGQFQQMRGKKGEYDGEAQRVAQIQLDNLKGDMTMLHAAFENISVELFEKNNDWLRSTVKWFTELLHGFGEFLKKNPLVSKGIVIIGAALATVSTAFGAFAILLMSVFGPMLMTKFILSRVGLSLGGLFLKTGTAGMGLKSFGKVILMLATSPFKLLSGAIKSIGTIISFVGRLFLASPIGLIITAIALASTLIYKYWQPISAFFVGMWQGFKNAMQPVIDAFAPLIELFRPLAPFFEWIGNAISTVIDWFSDLFTPVKSTQEELESATSAGVIFGKVLAGAVKIIIAPIQFIIKLFGKLLGFILNLPEKVSNLWGNIKEVFSEGILDKFTNFGGFLIDGFVAGIKEKWNEVKDTVSNLADGVTGWFKDILGIHSPSRVFADFGGYTVEGYQLGIEKNQGNAIRSMSRFADEITETSAPINSKNLIIDNRQPIASKQSAVTNNTAEYHITINSTSGTNNEQLAQLVVQEIERRERQKASRIRSSLRDID